MIVVILKLLNVKDEGEGNLSKVLATHFPGVIPGLASLEALQDTRKDSDVRVISRWLDVASFEAWRNSSTGTALVESISEEVGHRPEPLLLRPTLLEQSVTVHYLACDKDGIIRAASSAVEQSIRKPKSVIQGFPIQDLLPERDARLLMKRVADPPEDNSAPFLLNFVDANNMPYTLSCQVDVQSDGFVLMGERVSRQEGALQSELLQLNNEMAVLNRESLRKSRSLEKVTKVLETELLNKRQLAVELERSNQDLLDFAHIASHDLLEPLRTMSGFSQLLRRRYTDKLDADGQEFIDYIVSGTQRLHRLINDLLTYSNVSRGGQPNAYVNLNEVVEEVKSTLRLAIEESGAVIECSDLPQVWANRGQMVQLFANLVTNSIRFRASRTPHIVISCKATEQSYLVSISDNGTGIEQDYLEDIFEPFKRLHNEKSSGSGIGLALCRRVVEKHGGAIWADSVFGEGTTVFFTLDRAAELPAAVQALG